jgi:hypothetical protein
MSATGRRADREANSAEPSRVARATVAIFFALLWLPLVATLFGERASISQDEQRYLAPAPPLALDWRSLDELPHRIESWYDDHFGFRRQLIRMQSLLEIELFGTAPTDLLVVGRQGWLFFGDADAIASYRGLARLDPVQLLRWRQVLEERRDWLAERGIVFLVVLVPDKHLVYPEYMPTRLPRVSEVNPLSQLVDYLARNSNVDVLDLRPVLADARTRERIYHRTDTHWNDIGAYAGYSAILERLALRVPGLAGAAPAPVRFVRRMGPGLGLASIVGLAPLLREDLLELQLEDPKARVKPEYRAGYDERVRRMLPIALGVDDSKLPRAVVFRDSFANALVPYLSEDFRRVLYVWDRDVDPQVVAVEQPDVVIQEIVSRFLVRPPRGIGDLLKERER